MWSAVIPTWPYFLVVNFCLYCLLFLILGCIIWLWVGVLDFVIFGGDLPPFSPPPSHLVSFIIHFYFLFIIFIFLPICLDARLFLHNCREVWLTFSWLPDGVFLSLVRLCFPHRSNVSLLFTSLQDGAHLYCSCPYLQRQVHTCDRCFRFRFGTALKSTNGALPCNMRAPGDSTEFWYVLKTSKSGYHWLILGTLTVSTAELYLSGICGYWEKPCLGLWPFDFWVREMIDGRYVFF